MQMSAVTKHELLEGIQNIQTLHPMNKHLITSQNSIRCSQSNNERAVRTFCFSITPHQWGNQSFNVTPYSQRQCAPLPMLQLVHAWLSTTYVKENKHTMHLKARKWCLETTDKYAILFACNTFPLQAYVLCINCPITGTCWTGNSQTWVRQY